jgi:capsular polysaccharide biosynthesis protein
MVAARGVGSGWFWRREERTFGFQQGAEGTKPRRRGFAPHRRRSPDKNTMKTFYRILIPALILIPIFFVISISRTVSDLSDKVPIYQSTAILEAPAPASDQTADSYQIQIDTDIRIANMPETIAQARNALRRPMDEILSKLVKISVHQENGTRLVQLSVDATDAAFAADFANAWQSAFIDTMKSDSHQDYRLIGKALPGNRPITPRAMERIIHSAKTGVVMGGISALVLSWLINLGINKSRRTRQ